MRVIVLGTHEYQWALWPFAALWAKYASPDPLLYIGDRLDDEGLPDNVDFMQVPAYREGVWDWRKWFSNGFVSILAQFWGELLLVFLPDHWLNQPVDHTGLDRIAGYMTYNDNIFRAGLHIDRLNTDHYEQLEDGIISIPPHDIHAGFHGGTTFCPSIWRPDVAARMFDSGWSLWDCELVGTQRAATLWPRKKAITAYPGVISYTHGLVHTSRKVNCVGLSDEDRRMVIESLPEGMIC